MLRRLPFWVLAFACAPFAGCFCDGGACPEEGCGDLDPEAGCSDEDLPSGGGPTLVLGTLVDGEFRTLDNGQRLQLDYGPQGGQHFYYSIRAFELDADWLLLAR